MGRLKRLAVGLCVLMVLGLGAWFLLIPYPWRLANRNPDRTALQEQRIQEALEDGDTLEIRQSWVTLDDVSPRLVRAVLVAEDHRFREHGGIDWQALAEEVRWTGGDEFSWTRVEDLGALTEALGYLWAHRDSIRGRSTLTQQLAKNLYFGTERSFLRKAMEMVVAKRLERRLAKDRILELYLNVVEWGPGLFGAEAASRVYFGIPASELTLRQAAALAGTLPHPLTSNPATKPGRMRWRQERILERLSGPSPPQPDPLSRPEMELSPPVMDAPGDEGSVLPGNGTAPTPRGTAPVEVEVDSIAVPDTVGGRR